MEQGQPDGALEIFEGIFRSRDPQTHPYAMGAMCLAKAYGQAGDSAMEERYLILAATMDIRLAVKENEALLALATRLFEKGDIDRAYSYISYALNDANFYNSRFKNTVIARLYPIIESSYLYKLDKQRHNLRSIHPCRAAGAGPSHRAVFLFPPDEGHFACPAGSWRRLRRSSSA